RSRQEATNGCRALGSAVLASVQHQEIPIYGTARAGLCAWTVLRAPLRTLLCSTWPLGFAPCGGHRVTPRGAQTRLRRRTSDDNHPPSLGSPAGLRVHRQTF